MFSSLCGDPGAGTRGALRERLRKTLVALHSQTGLSSARHSRTGVGCDRSSRINIPTRPLGSGGAVTHFLAPPQVVDRRVDQELEQAEAHQTGSAAAQQAPLAAPSLQHASNALANDDLRQLRKSLEALRQGGGAFVFDSMRKLFDDAFYCVDKMTLVEVERAQERAVNLQDWLDGLGAAQKGTV